MKTIKPFIISVLVLSVFSCAFGQTKPQQDEKENLKFFTVNGERKTSAKAHAYKGKLQRYFLRKILNC